jgi:fermentation-respiration switch protein FrsA (DUF1100 family)
VKRVLTVLAVAGVVAALGFGALAAMLWSQQERIVFQPPGPPHPPGGSARRIDFSAPDGQPLFAFLVAERNAGRGLVIVFHGNADLAAWQIPWAEEVARQSGRAVLLAEYRGYGGLSGAPTYASGQLDARGVYSVARDSLGVPPERIVLFGHSLGSAIAAELAREVKPEALVLVAPLTSVRDMARRISPAAAVLYWLRLARVHYDTEAIVRSLDVPVWVAHGTDDEVIPMEMGRRVFDAARRKGELLVVERGDHNGLVETARERYWDWLTRAMAGQAGS